jgi:hypothetical protein
MHDTLMNIGWALVFALVGCATGTALLIWVSSKIPAIFDKLTPNIDEGKEIVRGNRAVAEYFGRVVAAAIIGVSVIIAASVLGALVVALR